MRYARADLAVIIVCRQDASVSRISPPPPPLPSCLIITTIAASCAVAKGPVFIKEQVFLVPFDILILIPWTATACTIQNRIKNSIRQLRSALGLALTVQLGKARLLLCRVADPLRSRNNCQSPKLKQLSETRA